MGAVTIHSKTIKDLLCCCKRKPVNARFCQLYRISQPIRHTMIFSLGILEKNNDEYILILVIYWMKTGLLHTKISTIM